jgi:hypothetical protein
VYEHGLVGAAPAFPAAIEAGIDAHLSPEAALVAGASEAQPWSPPDALAAAPVAGGPAARPSPPAGAGQPSPPADAVGAHRSPLADAVAKAAAQLASPPAAAPRGAR